MIETGLRSDAAWPLASISTNTMMRENHFTALDPSSKTLAAKNESVRRRHSQLHRLSHGPIAGHFQTLIVERVYTRNRKYASCHTINLLGVKGTLCSQ